MSTSNRARTELDDAQVVWPDLHPTTQAAFNEILWKRGLPRVEVARSLGVSRTRLTTITKDLEDHGLVTAGHREQRSSTGRPAEMLFANLDRYHFLGVHLAGGEAVAAIVDLANEVVWSDQCPLASVSQAEVEELMARWLRRSQELGFRVAGIGVCPERPAEGEADPFDLTRLPSRMPVDTGAEGAAPVGVPVWVEDDVNALTAFEQWPRLANVQNSMALIAVGSEVRVGLIVDQKIVVGGHDASGRIAHLVVASDGGPCPQGHRGCLWSLTAERALVALVPGATSIRDIAQRAAAGDATADAALRSAARGLGSASGAIARLLDPDRLVFTGESAWILRGRETDFDAALTAALGGSARADVDVTDPDSVEWAQAAGSLAQYRTLSRSIW